MRPAYYVGGAIALALIFGRRGAAAPLAGRILLVGDSLSLPGQPGAYLAKFLAEAGRAIQVDAVGGRSAGSLLASGIQSGILAGELASKPAMVVVFLGTNDAANLAIGGSEKGVDGAWRRLAEKIKASGARGIAIGPPSFAPGTLVGRSPNRGPIAPGVEPLIAIQRRHFPEWLDARPMTSLLTTPGISRDAAGIHFFDKAARSFGGKLAEALEGE